MAEIDHIVLRNSKKFIAQLNSMGIHVKIAYLFGSHLKGKADEWSDIDIAIISPQIGNDRFEERITLTNIAIAIDDRIEPLPFNPKSFVKNDPLVCEIIANGVTI